MTLAAWAALARTARPHNGLICGTLLVLGGGHGGTACAATLPAAVALFLLCCAAHLVNDLVDLPADRVNRPARPLPAGRLNRGVVRRTAGITLAVGLAAGLLLRPEWWPWWLFWSVGGPGYSLLAKGRDGIAPLWAAALVSTCYLPGTLGSGSVRSSLIVFIAISYFVYFREKVKAWEDVSGDVRAGLAGGDQAVHRLVPVLLALPMVAAGALAMAASGNGAIPSRVAAVVSLVAAGGAPLLLFVPCGRQRHWSGTLLKLGAFCGLPLLGLVRGVAAS